MKKTKLILTFALILMLLCSCVSNPKSEKEQASVSVSVLQTTAETSTEVTTSEAVTTTAYTTTLPQEEATTTAVSTAEASTEKAVTSTAAAKTQTTKEEQKTTRKETTKPENHTTKPYTTKPQNVTTTKAIKPSTVVTATQTTKPSTTVRTTSETTQAPPNYCTIAIDIKNIKNNIGSLKSEKKPFVTADRYILKSTKVAFQKGDTAFDILKKACKENPCSDNCRYCKNGIQLESVFTPAFQSYYVEGIHQLYEKDCGSMSGWMYSVNGKFPDVSSSAYEVKNGDTIMFAYTCDMGEDLGQSY